MKKQKRKLRGLNMKSILIATILVISLWALPNADRGIASVTPITPPLQNATSCGPMDVAFVIDHSGSMNIAINNIKSQIAGILDDIEASSGNDFRLALVSFGSTINVRQPFTSNRATFESQLSNLNLGDSQGRECSDEALDTVINARAANNSAIPPGRQIGDFTPDFRTDVLKIAILVTDVTPGRFTGVFTPDPLHTNPNTAESHAHQVAVQAAARGIKVSAVYVNTGNVEKPDAIRVMNDYASTTDSFFIEDTTNGNMTGEAITQIIASCGGSTCESDSEAPVFDCPGDLTIGLDPGQCSGAANYTAPTATDNCTVTSITCSPPPGAPLPIGPTEVQCVARDGAGNESVCRFQVTVQDKTAPVISCPANPASVTASGSCTASVTFARAAATDSCGGEVTVRGVRLDTNQEVGASGVFPIGDTFIQWIAIDKAGNQTICPTQQKVTVIGQANIAVPTEVDFGGIDFQIAKKKKAKKRFVSLVDSARTFSIKNNGCGSVTLTLKSINRIGEDVTNGKITNTDDSDFFFVQEQGGGIKSPTSNNQIQLASLEEKKINVTFRPELPISSGGKNSGLSTKQALPDPFRAEMILMDGTGATFKITLKADLSNEVHFINPDDIQKKAPVVDFSKSGDVFTVEYTLYDADTGGKQADSASFVKSAKYEFLDNSGEVVETVDVDLAGPIEAANLAKGQRFKVTKTFSGANDNSSVSRVRVTVTDGAASPSLEANLGSGAAIQSFVSIQGFAYKGDVTIYLPGDRLEWFKR